MIMILLNSQIFKTVNLVKLLNSTFVFMINWFNYYFPNILFVYMNNILLLQTKLLINLKIVMNNDYTQ